MTSVRRTLSALVAAALAGVLLTFAASGGAATTSIKVTITDSKIALSKKTAQAGTVTFVVTNKGMLVHNFKIGSKATKPLAHGKSQKLIVTFKAAKAYPYLSTLPKGKTKGLKGVFKVTKAATSSGGGAASGSLAAGLAVFKANCGSCHSLKAAGTTGQVGPNLDQVKPTQAKIIAQVTNGSRFMPPFGGQLSATQIKDVAAFVSQSAGK